MEIRSSWSFPYIHVSTSPRYYYGIHAQADLGWLQPPTKFYKKYHDIGSSPAYHSSHYDISFSPLGRMEICLSDLCDVQHHHTTEVDAKFTEPEDVARPNGVTSHATLASSDEYCQKTHPARLTGTASSTAQRRRDHSDSRDNRARCI